MNEQTPQIEDVLHASQQYDLYAIPKKDVSYQNPSVRDIQKLLELYDPLVNRKEYPFTKITDLTLDMARIAAQASPPYLYLVLACKDTKHLLDWVWWIDPTDPDKYEPALGLKNGCFPIPEGTCTLEELAKLKADWYADPCYDLTDLAFDKEYVKKFGYYYSDLKRFQQRTNDEAKAHQQQELNNELMDMGLFDQSAPNYFKLGQYIVALERRVRELEEKLEGGD